MDAAPRAPETAPDAAEARATRRLVVLYGLTGFTTSLAWRSLDPLLPAVAADLGVTLGAVALLASAYALPYALVQPVLGPLGDALGKRRIIAVACLLTALAFLASTLAPSYGWLFALRVVTGAAAGGIYPLIIATFGDRVPLARRQVALSRVLAFTTAGAIAGGVVAGVLAEHLSWRAIQALCAASVLVSAAVLWRDLAGEPDPPPTRPRPAAALSRYREILRLTAARRLYAAVAVEGVIVYGGFPYVAGIVLGWGLGGPATAGVALAAFGVAGIAYGTLSAPLLARLGPLGVLRLAGGLGAVGFAAAALPGLGALSLGAAPLVLGLFLVGLAYFMTHTGLQTRVTEVAPGARGSAVALHACSFFVGQSLGPVLFGAALALGGPAGAFLACGAGMAALCWGLARALRRG